MVNVGSIFPQVAASISIFENGTWTVGNRHGSLLNGLQSAGVDEGKALMLNSLYSNGTLVCEIYNGPTFVIVSNGTRVLIVSSAGQQFVLRAAKQVPWFVLLHQSSFIHDSNI